MEFLENPATQTNMFVLAFNPKLADVLPRTVKPVLFSAQTGGGRWSLGRARYLDTVVANLGNLW